MNVKNSNLNESKSGPRIAMIVFPGSNCDQDAEKAFQNVFGWSLFAVRSSQEQFGFEPDAVFIPGGFSYGDYLRAGHLASISPIIPALKKFIAQGGSVLGVCNGFQILTEIGALPGVLLPNSGSRFVCRWVECEREVGRSSFHVSGQGELLRLPIAHGEGRYYLEAEEYQQLEQRGQVFLRYRENPNGSTGSVAGVCSENGRVFGMMPHPERAYSARYGGADGGRLLRAFAATFV